MTFFHLSLSSRFSLMLMEEPKPHVNRVRRKIPLVDFISGTLFHVGQVKMLRHFLWGIRPRAEARQSSFFFFVLGPKVGLQLS